MKLIQIFAISLLTVRVAGQINLTVGKPNAADVNMNWSGGGAPYTISRSNRPDFAASVSLLAQSTSATTFTYTGAQLNGQATEFFTVGDGTTPASGTGNGFPDPPLQPMITTLSSATATDNETVTLTGTGFSSFAAANIVFFDGKPAVADTAAFSGFASSNATTITVKVPPGATSGYVRVFVNGLLSNPVPLTVLVNNSGSPFNWTNIRALAFVPGTRALLVADATTRNTIDRLDFNTGTKTWSRTQVKALTNPLVSTRADTNGFYYYVNASTQPVPFNIGRVKADGTGDQGFGGCYNPGVGIVTARIPLLAADNSLTDTVYCGYIDVNPGTNPSHIVKKTASGPPADLDYGNLGAAGYAFQSGLTDGAVTDKAGNLYVAETTRIRKVSPSESVSVVMTGFNSLTGLDWAGSSASDPGFLVAVDRGANKVYILDLGQTPIKMQEIIPQTPFNVPVAAVFGQEPDQQTSVLYVAENPATASLKRVFRLRDPRVGDSDVPLKMLISKQVNFDSYPEPALQSSDGAIKLRFGIIPAPAAGKTIYARVIDPADTSGYQHLTAQPNCTVDTPLGNKCDNFDQTYGFGSGSSLAKTASTVTDANGFAEFTLKMAPDAAARFSGDNYQVQVSFDDFASAPSPLVIGVSPIIIAYKRVYVQRSAMYQQGGMLASDYPHSGCTKDQIVLDINDENLVSTYCGGGFPCDTAHGLPANLQLALLDKDHPADNPTQTGTILGISMPTLNCGAGNVLVTLTSPLTTGATFIAGVDGSIGQKGAGVGIVNIGAFPKSFTEKQPFEDAFTEYEIPPLMQDLVTPYANAAFFGNCGGTTQAAKDWSNLWSPLANNKRHVAFTDKRPTGSDACTSQPSLLLTTIQVGNAMSSLGCGSVTGCAGLPAYMIWLCDHEGGHPFTVDNCQTVNPTHDDHCDWVEGTGATTCTNPIASCLMNPTGTAVQRSSTRRLFDAFDLLLGDPACATPTPSTSIRRHADPLQ